MDGKHNSKTSGDNNKIYITEVHSYTRFQCSRPSWADVNIYISQHLAFVKSNK